MSQTEDGKWRVEFNEPWAKEGAKPPEAEAETEGEAVSEDVEAPGADVLGRSAA
jgi:DNA topoisomerase-3